VVRDDKMSIVIRQPPCFVQVDKTPVAGLPPINVIPRHIEIRYCPAQRSQDIHHIPKRRNIVEHANSVWTVIQGLAVLVLQFPALCQFDYSAVPALAGKDLDIMALDLRGKKEIQVRLLVQVPMQIRSVCMSREADFIVVFSLCLL